jgi:hypothetical protein
VCQEAKGAEASRRCTKEDNTTEAVRGSLYLPLLIIIVQEILVRKRYFCSIDAASTPI